MEKNQAMDHSGEFKQGSICFFFVGFRTSEYNQSFPPDLFEHAVFIVLSFFYFQKTADIKISGNFLTNFKLK